MLRSTFERLFDTPWELIEFRSIQGQVIKTRSREPQSAPSELIESHSIQVPDDLQVCLSAASRVRLTLLRAGRGAVG